jgi:hypothetical protein
MTRKAVSVDEAIRIIKDSLDDMDMDALTCLIEHFMPCKNVSYSVETDEIDYDLDPEMDSIDVFSERSRDLPAASS